MFISSGVLIILALVLLCVAPELIAWALLVFLLYAFISAVGFLTAVVIFGTIVVLRSIYKSFIL